MRYTAFAFVVASLTVAQAAQQPKLPPPFHTPSANNPPRVVPKPQGAKVNVPAGFRVDIWAEGFERPRFMAEGPGGEILLSDSTRKGKVWVLTNDGKNRRELLGGLDRPYGIAFWKDYVYVAETTSVKRYKYDAKARTVGPGAEVVSLKDHGQGHWTRNILFDPDGAKMYLAVGSQSNVSPGEPEIRAAISRYNPDGSGHELWATGTRNPIGMRWYPGTKDLWAAVQERDALGDDLVPDYLTQIHQGAFYGWPYGYVGKVEDPRNKGKRPDLVAKMANWDVLLPAHAAVLDFIFYTGKQFPKEYQGGAFLAYHGSWNRAKRLGYSVAFVPFKDGKPAGEPKEFLTGFMLGPDEKEVWGRPVGLLQLPDGSVLLSEDGGNRIWRISYGK
ncbi:MAG TPA: PQQ-dependent sugar dehydrogenase [Bryobacteraceae bacterium]|nr:PQQ-dependent sugar dehydrogenase [Bryobacteraceae bacterium]